MKISTVVWRSHSSFLPCYLQIPISLIPNSDSKEIGNRKETASKMREYNQNLTWLADYCPEFPVSSKRIHILKEPSEFFATLKV